MKKWIILSTTFLLGFLLLETSCGKCGDNKKLGDLDLEEVTKNWLFYQGDEVLVFADSNGTEEKLEVIGGLINNRVHLITKTLCENLDNFSDFAYEYYEQQEFAIQFFTLDGSPTISMILSGGVDVEKADNPQIYDKLFLECRYRGTLLGSVNSITSDRGNSISQVHKNVFIIEPDNVDEFTIHGKTFVDVYFINTDQGTGFYYTKDQGVVAMKLAEGDFRHLVRIE